MPVRSASRGRSRTGTPWLQWIALLSAATVIMGLTFALGILVGRQWGRPASAALADSAPRKTVPPGKRGGLVGSDVEAPSVDQKLTFYQTLTAPLGRGSADASPRRDEKPKTPAATEAGRSDAAPHPYPYATRGETTVERPAHADLPSATDKTVQAAAEAAGPWAVQAAAFKTQAQADALQKQLKNSGFDAYVAPAAAADGQTNYRVRIGTFKSKAEAQRVADRVRGERSLAAFITPK
jgi:cell division septation protein DedD